MADKLDTAPTQGNLLELQEQLAQIRSGHALLERKREVLIKVLTDTLKEAEQAEAEARDLFQAAHKAIQSACMRLGSDRLRWISRPATIGVTLDLQTKSIMGVKVPLVQVELQPGGLLPYGPDHTSVSLDHARQQWLEVVQLLGRLAETVTTVWRVTQELRKTQRLVNALESLIIPRYENTVDYIEQVLEEENREGIIRAKKVKAMHERTND